MTRPEQGPDIAYSDIAIVGMAAHLPGAETIAQYWDNLRSGVSSIARLSEAELLDAGVPQGLLRRKDYVPYAARLDGFEMFDAEFFGFSPKEAAILDPQHRRFLEVAWEAMENAGHVPQNFPGPVGVFAGCGMGSYFYFNLCSNPDLVDSTGMFLLRHTGNDKDFLTTRASHIFDLKGPSLSLQTACSTSLVAVHYAAQSLLNGECDMALAGGVTIELPQGQGYFFKENEILSPDGACHAFDHRAQGTVFGSGTGVVVLRRLSDAIADGDHIWAVIKGSAVNNDGADKAGYLAPSVGGQAAAVAEAQAIANTPAGTIDYVECHGTGTYLGDPIEVSALTAAFRETTEQTGFCRIGSVKTNIGHLDTAAGAASLIKTALSLKHGQMPPSLGYEAPNPAIDFEASPFRVNDSLRDWPRRDHPRRAGVNSLGVGGTNVHVVLEEAPERAASDAPEFPFQILTLSARSKAALDGNATRLATHLRHHPEHPLADIAYTLREGRADFTERRVVVAETHAEAATLLEKGDRYRVHSHKALTAPDVAFLFPGGGAQYPQMARGLYETEPVFADWMTRGLDHLATLTADDPRDAWLASGPEAEQRLRQPSVQLPLILITEVALAKLWESWGVVPAALMGHSMGENTAACIAGVLGFEDAIGLVHLRGRLFDSVPRGGMLSVAMSEAALLPHLGDDLDLAAVNSAQLSVATGPVAALDALEARLKAQGVECQRIGIDVAAHSRMLEPILPAFRDYLAGLDLKAPQIPIISNRSGTWMTDAEATSPDYWVDHLRNTVRFADGVATIAAPENRVLMEVGPGHALSTLARQQPQIGANRVLPALRHPNDAIADDRYFHEVLGRLWGLGVAVDWDQVWGEARRNRVPLPSYAFQHAPYFIEPGNAVSDTSARYPARSDDMRDWGAVPIWRPRAAEPPVDIAHDADALPTETWLVFADDAGLARDALTPLKAAGHRVIEVRPGDVFARLSDTAYNIAPERGREGYDLLLSDLAARGFTPSRIAHFWGVTADESHRPGSSFFHRLQEQGFYSLLFLGQALVDEGLSHIHIDVVTNGAARVRDEALPHPVKATIAGPVRVIPREAEGLTLSTLDVVLPEPEPAPFWRAKEARQATETAHQSLCHQITDELISPPGTREAAIRDGRRYERALIDAPLSPAPQEAETHLSGTILMTGGFGGICRTLGLAAARNGAKLILVSRTDLPPRSDWTEYTRRHAPQDPVRRAIAHVEALEAAGAEVMVATADVCNEDAMRRVRDAATDRFGPIAGVIHAAGRLSDQPFLALSPADVEDIFTPKLHGTDVIDRLFSGGVAEWIAYFSSVSTMAAAAGQLDYVAANEYLNALAQARAGDATRSVAINWGIWAEAGMAADALARRTGDTEPAPEIPVSRALLDTMSFDAEGRRVLETQFSTRDWIIDEHRTRDGLALLPGTASVTLAAHALSEAHEGAAFEIRDLAFLRPLTVPEDGARSVTTRLERTEAGYKLDLLCEARAEGRVGLTRFAEAQIDLRARGAAPRIDLPAIRARLRTPETAPPGQTLTTGQEAHLDFGPRWRVLTARALSPDEGLADLTLAKAAEGDDCLVHPALLDIATGWAMELIPGYVPDHLWVPLSYARVTLWGPLPDRIVSWVRPAQGGHSSAESASFDVTLAAPDGTVVMEIAGFAIRRLDDPAQLRRAPRLTAAEIETEMKGTGAALSPGEEMLQHNLGQGIRADEGAEAFARALAQSRPVIAVSPVPVAALRAQADIAARPATQMQAFDRPVMDEDFAAPETDIEKRLAGFWEELLGVRNVGVDDSFFDLGGHSLIAVRLFSMVKKAYRVDFPISVLFEAPTIRACAALIAEKAGISDTASGDADAPAQIRPERRFSHIVPMHEGEPGSKPPFFLVAGMFGNVLNLRHLALLMGRDRPFYGLQAKGLYGDEDPHRSIEEAARDYIAELKQVQPDGPYHLGGFSGGGIIAFEMARQLGDLGDEVALVALLDTPLPQKRPLLAVDRAVIQWQELRRKGVGYPLIWAQNRIRWEIEKRRAKDATDAPESFHNTEIEAAFLGAIAAYDMAPYAGRVVLFRPPLREKWRVAGGRLVNDERAYLSDDNDWGEYLSDLQVIEVPGDHDSMVLEPNVRVLAAALAQAMRDAARPGDAGAVVPFARTEAAE
ncbi:type I polyketide synthase [Roseivivax sp. THAF197b]|uniref:type I polyketide synthase n=1 Tax=Roseivivax sp. THAF197b TaxID=2588299 RepID=UPI00126815D6|nr:type I polyketide synthase [Roseivivax sp. THAF197b]QFS84593.1 Phthiocerol synthesis polyketide synthase type I PpsE [Roseivivax sp. THAF197b]